MEQESRLKKALESNERAINSIHKDMVECVINLQETSTQFLKNYFGGNNNYIDNDIMADLRCHIEQLDDLLNKIEAKRKESQTLCSLIKS